MQGHHLHNEHYAFYDGNPYSSREEGESSCAAKGLTLCSTSAITGFQKCSAGWLTDGAGWWMNLSTNGVTCGYIGFNAADWVPEDELVIGAYW